MIVLLTVIVLIISFFDITLMLKNGLIREIVVFAIFSIITLAFGYYYIPNKQTFSLIGGLFELLKIEY